jgi:predicted transcriptional regulator
MPQNISNNQKDGLTRAKIAKELEQAAGNIARNKIARESDRQRQQLTRAGIARELERQKQQASRQQEQGEADQENRPKTPIEEAIEEFGPATITPEGNAESTEERSVPAEMGHVLMPPVKDFGIQSQGDENVTPEELPQETGVKEPTRPEVTEGGGPMKTDEEKEGPIAKYGALKTGKEEPEKPAKKKPGEEEEETPPGEADQASKITSAQEKGRNAAQLAQAAKGGITGGKEEALMGAAGLPPSAGKAMSLYKKYKWIIWIGTFIITNFWWIIGGLIAIVLLIIVVLIVNFMINNPGTTFFNAMWCGTENFFLGGDGFKCLLKAATEAATKAATEAPK